MNGKLLNLTVDILITLISLIIAHFNFFGIVGDNINNGTTIDVK